MKEFIENLKYLFEDYGLIIFIGIISIVSLFY